MSQGSGATSVLVIDDEPGLRELLRFELADEGYNVETAGNGAAAVNMLAGRRFDLAITDLKMPGTDGMAVVDALRSCDPDIEVIVMTGYATDDTAVACMNRGAFDFIRKPFDLAELKLVVKQALQKRHNKDSQAIAKGQLEAFRRAEPN